MKQLPLKTRAKIYTRLFNEINKNATYNHDYLEMVMQCCTEIIKTAAFRISRQSQGSVSQEHIENDLIESIKQFMKDQKDLSKTVDLKGRSVDIEATIIKA